MHEVPSSYGRYMLCYLSSDYLSMLHRMIMNLEGSKRRALKLFDAILQTGFEMNELVIFYLGLLT